MVKNNYRIAYVKGDLPNSSSELLKLKSISGRLFINEKGIRIEGNKEKFEFNFNDIVSCKYKRRQLFGFIILKSNKYTINLFIPRINLFNWFLVTNFVATIMVYRHLKNKFKKK